MSPPAHSFLVSYSLCLCLNMATKQACNCEEKSVLVTLYVEKPRKRLNHHHHHHHTIKGKGFHHNYIGNGRGNGRRALLLQYSQTLRKSAPLNPKTLSSNVQQPIIKVAAGPSKPKHKKVSACLGGWKLSIACIFKPCTSAQDKEMSKKKRKNSGSSRSNFKAVTKNLKVQKKLGFISKLFKPSQKHT